MSITSVNGVRGWDEFRAALTEILFASGTTEPDRFLFRGQRVSNWPLRPSFDRTFPEVALADRRKTAENMLVQFRAACEAQGVPSDVLFSDDLLALGQHHGLPTRLLDWSASPYMAAFFAFASFVMENPDLTPVGQQRADLASLDSPLTREELAHALEDLPGLPPVAVWALDLTDPIWKSDAGVQIKNASSQAHNVRLRNQGGAFTVLNATDEDLGAWADASKSTHTLIWKFVLPSCVALEALSDLRLMGIDYSRAYPDLQGGAFNSKLQLLCRRLEV